MNNYCKLDFIPLSRKSQNLSKADMNKYCKYHHNNGHTINECITLRDKVKKLIHVDHLKCFVRHDEGNSSSVTFKVLFQLGTYR